MMRTEFYLSAIKPRPSVAPRAAGCPRRGAVIIVVMVCFILAGAFFVSLARTAALERQASRLRQWNLQALWLAEAGLERAVAQLGAAPDYAGETWSVTPEELSGRRGAAVKISVEPVAGRPEQRRIRAVADFPDDPRDRCRCTKEIVVGLNNENGTNVE